MNIVKNEGIADRGTRLILSEILFLLGFFWLGGILQIAFYLIGLIMLVTAIVGYCGLYKIFGISTCSSHEKLLSKTGIGILFFVSLLIVIGGGYASNFFTKKIFLDDYTAMNQSYKQALFYTGQIDREQSVKNYTELQSAYADFRSKYQGYHPYVVSHDAQFNEDLDRIATMIAMPRDKILSGDLKSAHLDLEQVRPVFQNILKRNAFSMLAVSLVDFHDAMETIIAAADAKDPELVIATYPLVSDRLKAVEEVANDTEIQTIRQNLEQLLDLSKTNDTEALSAKAAEMKSSFVKVYLKRG
ncbi:MAG: hypothetical protein A2845_04455 [Candidatus Lloydbacteria bacterium RIFCSPHIGHO2_01_FULL_49_22]|uniref:Inner membrane protein YgaP-like transmembrane domain-containing protein n=1 Tax=Candidatus Lloydbacteria bacterium RIFCSPHIGHO2_01_FULL_49_22 TaxID=1798658 RepID=A0A1G2CUL8_9BACT|nr:MAG: hypothetical protein A2845_04455 [Candidatus Lloydbacteria bacterium RIFCSPHIGHO2_01_FULL_49_22]OGZ08902.1 MAG: hypothetical protein A3C14_01490 [Candidatus Lloydbacteria bacterium RIFCSPHIGHO2_02_FULL_50_18]